MTIVISLIFENFNRKSFRPFQRFLWRSWQVWSLKILIEEILGRSKDFCDDHGKFDLWKFLLNEWRFTFQRCWVLWFLSTIWFLKKSLFQRFISWGCLATIKILRVTWWKLYVLRMINYNSEVWKKPIGRKARISEGCCTTRWRRGNVSNPIIKIVRLASGIREGS